MAPRSNQTLLFLHDAGDRSAVEQSELSVAVFASSVYKRTIRCQDSRRCTWRLNGSTSSRASQRSQARPTCSRSTRAIGIVGIGIPIEDPELWRGALRRATRRRAAWVGSFFRPLALLVVRSAPLTVGVAWRGLDAGRAGTPRGPDQSAGVRGAALRNLRAHGGARCLRSGVDARHGGGAGAEVRQDLVNHRCHTSATRLLLYGRARNARASASSARVEPGAPSSISRR